MTNRPAPSDADWRTAAQLVGWSQHTVYDWDGDPLPEPGQSVWVLSDPYRGVPVVEVRRSQPELELEHLGPWFLRSGFQLTLSLHATGWTAQAIPSAAARAALGTGYGTPEVHHCSHARVAAVLLAVQLAPIVTEHALDRP